MQAMPLTFSRPFEPPTLLALVLMQLALVQIDRSYLSPVFLLRTHERAFFTIFTRTRARALSSDVCIYFCRLLIAGASHALLHATLHYVLYALG